MFRHRYRKWVWGCVCVALVVATYLSVVEDWRRPMQLFQSEFNETYITAEVDTTLVQDLDRPLQEVVTIDLEDHKEPVYFTWEDIKAYFYTAVDYIDNLTKKHDNDHH